MKPTLSELEKFEDQPEGIDLEVVTESTGIWSLSVTQAKKGVAWQAAPTSVLHLCLQGRSGSTRAADRSWLVYLEPNVSASQGTIPSLWLRCLMPSPAERSGLCCLDVCEHSLHVQVCGLNTREAAQRSRKATWEVLTSCVMFDKFPNLSVLQNNQL